MTKKYIITEFGYAAGVIMWVTPTQEHLHKGITKKVIDIYYEDKNLKSKLSTDDFISKMVECGLLEEVKEK